MSTIQHQLAIAASVSQVYAALSTAEGISTWWDKQTPVYTDRGLVLEHNPGPKHGVVRLRVVDLVPNRRVEWECVSRHPADSPASAWTGTRFIFELSEDESPASVAERDCAAAGEARRIVTVDFRQTGYDTNSVFFGFNNFAWASVLANLKKVCESQSN
jgi:uncharacterized protein YndB with AHSA1/START domain